MMPIRLIHGAAFDPETTKLLAQAYEQACERSGAETSIETKEGFARRIVAYAGRGERDFEKLVTHALVKPDAAPKAG
jgi:hypothetical protein